MWRLHGCNNVHAWQSCPALASWPSWARPVSRELQGELDPGLLSSIWLGIAFFLPTSTDICTAQSICQATHQSNPTAQHDKLYLIPAATFQLRPLHVIRNKEQHGPCTSSLPA